MNDTDPPHPLWSQVQHSTQQRSPLCQCDQGENQLEVGNITRETSPAQLPPSFCCTTSQTRTGHVYNADQAEGYAWNSQEYFNPEGGGQSAQQRLQNIANLVAGTYVSQEVHGSEAVDEYILDNVNPVETITQFLLPYHQGDATDPYTRVNGAQDSQSSTSSGPPSSIADNSEVGEHTSASQYPCDLCTKTYKLKRSLRYVPRSMHFSQLTNISGNIEHSMIRLRKTFVLIPVEAAPWPSHTLKTATAIYARTIQILISPTSAQLLTVDSQSKASDAATISSVTCATSIIITHALKPVCTDEQYLDQRWSFLVFGALFQPCALHNVSWDFFLPPTLIYQSFSLFHYLVFAKLLVFVFSYVHGKVDYKAKGL